MPADSPPAILFIDLSDFKLDIFFNPKLINSFRSFGKEIILLQSQ